MDTVESTWHDGITNFLERRPVIYQFLRFACIGFLNTGLAFLVQNTISKFFSVSQGIAFGGIVGIGFVCAVVQSYPWNRTWTFGGEMGVSLWKNLTRLAAVGILGMSALAFVAVAAKLLAPWWAYLLYLIVYLLVEEILWKQFGFHMSDWDHVGHSFFIFFVVTGIGFLIQSGLSALFSTHVHLLQNPDLNKNFAAALATGVSLFWNFVGYKVIVFKK